jgi:hypothetical protein
MTDYEMFEIQVAAAKDLAKEYMGVGMEADKAFRVALWIIKDGLTDVEALAYADNLAWDA